MRRLLLYHGHSHSDDQLAKFNTSWFVNINLRLCHMLRATVSAFLPHSWNLGITGSKILWLDFYDVSTAV